MSMDFMNSFGSRRKKIHLTTRRKLKVLLALNSKSPNCFSKNIDSDTEHISELGKEFMAFLQCEQFHIERLRELKQVLMHPILRENTESADDMINLVEEMLVTHCTVCACLFSNSSDSFKLLCSCLDAYISYSLLTNLEKNNFQKISGKCKGVLDAELLQEPILFISKCKILLENLYLAEPQEMYYNALKEVEMAWDKVQSRCFVHENAVKMLQIQRRLFRREPKILSPGRVLVKEGILYKVNRKGSNMEPRIFFLFNDALLCCKAMSKSFKAHDKDSPLLFSSLLPLKMCVVAIIMGSPKQGTLFKVTCGTKTYLLLSKIPGEARSWFEELQTAIRSSQKLNGELKLKLSRHRKVLKQSVSPFLKQPP